MRKIAEKVAWSLHGLPYRWGGDDPMVGFDCSGFVIEILKSVGKLPRSGDWTAQDLWTRFREKRVEHPYNGCLAFWHNENHGRVVHIEYCLNDKLTIGASGGGSRTADPVAAAKHNAYIKVRPIRFTNLHGYADPFLKI